MSDYDKVKERKRIAIIFSIICPGMGLIYYSRWLRGMIHFVLHLIFCITTLVVFIPEVINDVTGSSTGYDANYTLVYIFIALIIINWALSLLAIRRVRK